MHPSGFILPSSSTSNGFLTNLQNAYDFEESSGDLIDLAGSFDGTVTGTTRNVSSIDGYCYTFPNSIANYVDCGGTNEWEFTGDFTISLWVKITSLNTSNHVPIALMNNGTSDRSWRILLIRSNHATLANKMSLLLYDSSYVEYTLTGTTTFTTGTWYHLVGSRIGSSVSFYINGTSEASTTLSGALGTSTGHHTIGCWWWGGVPDIPWNGQIDAVYIWNGRGLTSDEVSELYNGGTGLFFSSFS